MNNEELKKKIADIVLGVEWTGCLGNTYHVSGGMSVANAIADALIAAGMVDKSDYASMKETAVRYKAEVSKAGARVKEAEAEANRYEMLYKLQNRDMALAERRAHDAEHRAELAERALFLSAKEIEYLNGNFDSSAEFFAKEKVIPYFMKQAEKELAEERKDD